MDAVVKAFGVTIVGGHSTFSVTWRFLEPVLWDIILSIRETIHELPAELQKLTIKQSRPAARHDLWEIVTDYIAFKVIKATGRIISVTSMTHEEWEYSAGEALVPISEGKKPTIPGVFKTVYLTGDYGIELAL